MKEKTSPVLEIARELVRIPSVNPGYAGGCGESEVADWIVEWAQREGLETTVEEVMSSRSNVTLRLRRGDGRHLLLNGHMDTVAVDEMTIPPHDGVLRGGRLWGRGSADMKGPLACMLETLRVLRDDNSWRGCVTLACVVDEECGFEGIKHFLKKHGKKEGFDFAVVGEPTRLQVIRGCKGCLRFYVRARGLAAHSSTPHLGKSAIYAMGRAVVALEDYFEKELSQIRDLDFGPSTGSVGLIKGGSGINIVPDFCEVAVDVRLLPEQDAEAVYKRIQEVVRKVDTRVEWEFDENPLIDHAFRLEEQHGLVEAARSVAAVPETKVAPFSCDASKIAAAGIPCIIFGPGDIAQAHTAEESIGLEELEQGVKTYVRLAHRLLG